MKRRIVKLLNAGAAKVAHKGQAENSVVLNKCLYAGLLMFIPNVVYEAYLQLPYTIVIDICYLLIILTCIALNVSGKYTMARNAIIISSNLLLLSGAYVEGLDAGNHIVYLPLIVLFSLLIKAGEEKKLLVGLFFLSSICITLCYLICPLQSEIQHISPDVYKTMFTENLLLAFLLTVMFTWMVAVISLERERQMIKAKDTAEESTRVKSMFLSNMSHELRTPLNGIIGTANLLLDEEYLAAQKEHLDVLSYSSGHMLTLINDILDFSKLDADKTNLQQNPVNLHRLFAQLTTVFTRQFEAKGLEFAVEKNPLLDSWILTDETKLIQVLNNLLGNALKFTQKGQVLLKAVILEQKSEYTTVHFEVSDTGIGIPEDKHEHIFESFAQADARTTRQFGGTGLGLSISKKIVTAMGGDLLVKSRTGGGSTFYFTVAFNRSNQLQSFIPHRKKIHFEPLKGLRLLIAEDNAINMKVACRFLQSWEIATTEAVNGREAVEKSREGNFDLLLMDLEMPEMDGYTALTEIRKFNKEIPAIAFTAAMFPDIKNFLTAKGFNDFATKPFRPEELYQKIKQYQKV
jgi:signal transduction histidine kinase